MRQSWTVDKELRFPAFEKEAPLTPSKAGKPRLVRKEAALFAVPHKQKCCVWRGAEMKKGLLLFIGMYTIYFAFIFFSILPTRNRRLKISERRSIAFI